LYVISILVSFASGASQAHADLESIFVSAANEYNVPVDILKSTCTWESQTFYQGRRQPWPWTVNVAGRGFYFKSSIGAKLTIAKAIKNGELNIDIGICQINWFWHGEQFSNPYQLLTPSVNIHYAASYLAKLKKKDESWRVTVGKYHSPSSSSRAWAYSQQVLGHNPSKL